jgi:hypothetical protein
MTINLFKINQYTTPPEEAAPATEQDTSYEAVLHHPNQKPGIALHVPIEQAAGAIAMAAAEGVLLVEPRIIDNQAQFEISERLAQVPTAWYCYPLAS